MQSLCFLQKTHYCLLSVSGKHPKRNPNPRLMSWHALYDAWISVKDDYCIPTHSQSAMCPHETTTELLTLLKSSLSTSDSLPGVGGEKGEGRRGVHRGSNSQLSASHYLPFGGLEMSWRCQTGYLLGPSSSGWPADSLRADQMAATPHWPCVRCCGSWGLVTHKYML